MNIFFDTTVLVAASVEDHPHHPQAMTALLRIVNNRDTGFMSTHSIAEVFAVLTRLPLQPRIHPTEAVRIITDNILAHFEVVPIRKQDYVNALKTMVEGGWAGAKVYDAVLLSCALKCNADRIYTFNLGDFRQLAAKPLHNKICSP